MLRFLRFVYLAGPIAGCTEDEAKDWRTLISRKFLPGIIGVSPLRCEPSVDGRYDIREGSQQKDPRFGSDKAIASKNTFDTLNCDLVLAYLPKEMNDRRPSYGTICEVAWAKVAGKQVLLVTDDPYLQAHPVVQDCVAWNLTTLDEAVEVVNGILEVYT